MRQALVRATRKAVRASGGRPVPAVNRHVTLAFLGSVPDRRRGELAQIARAMGSSADPPGAPLELAFDHLEHWRAAQLLCALPSQAPESLSALGRRLQERLAASGFAPDPESSRSVGVGTIKPFRPHVTLARKLDRSPQEVEMQPVTWSFTGFVLVESKTLPEGAVYTVVEKFPLDR